MEVPRIQKQPKHHKIPQTKWVPHAHAAHSKAVSSKGEKPGKPTPALSLPNWSLKRALTACNRPACLTQPLLVLLCLVDKLKFLHKHWEHCYDQSNENLLKHYSETRCWCADIELRFMIPQRNPATSSTSESKTVVPRSFAQVTAHLSYPVVF